MSKFTGTIKQGVIDGLTPKYSFPYAPLVELEGKKFELQGMSSFDEDVLEMKDITAENAGSVRFHYRSNTGFNINISIRELIGLAIVPAEGEKALNVAERITNVEGVERDADNDVKLPSVLTIVSAVNALKNDDEEESEENPALYRADQYQAFHDEMETMMAAWDKIPVDDQDNESHPRRAIYRNRNLMNKCVGTSNLLNPEAEPRKKVTIE